MSKVTWSVSRAQVAQTCTLRYHLKYRNTGKGTRPHGSVGRIGAAVHKLLEERLKGTPIRQAYVETIATERLVRKEVQRTQEFRDNIEAFVTRFHSWCARHGVGAGDVWYELPLHLRDGQAERVRFNATWTGKCDVVARKPDNSFVIIDHKTGEPQDASNYAFQLRSYAHALFVNFPDAQSVSTGIHWVGEPDPKASLVWAEKYTREDHAAELADWFEEEYNAVALRIEEPPAPSLGTHCAYCDHRNACPLMLLNRPR